MKSFLDEGGEGYCRGRVSLVELSLAANKAKPGNRPKEPNGLHARARTRAHALAVPHAPGAATPCVEPMCLGEVGVVCPLQTPTHARPPHSPSSAGDQVTVQGTVDGGCCQMGQRGLGCRGSLGLAVALRLRMSCNLCNSSECRAGGFTGRMGPRIRLRTCSVDLSAREQRQ